MGLVYERKIESNFFLVQFSDRKSHYLVRCLPFTMAEVDDTVAAELAAGDLHPDTLLPPPDDESLSLMQPGLLLQCLLILTTNCNLACRYCYADRGSYGAGGQDMKQGVVDAVLRLLTKRLSRHRDRIAGSVGLELPIVAFGGESLLCVDTIEYLITESRRVFEAASNEVGAPITPRVIINTNGLLVTPDLLQRFRPHQDMIEFVVSFDGLYHDENRIHPNGAGSSVEAVRGIRVLREHGFEFAITCCLPPKELVRVQENVEYIASIAGPKANINLSFIRGALVSLKRGAAYPAVFHDGYRTDDVAEFTRQVVQLIDDGHRIYYRKLEAKMRSGGFRHKCAACLYEVCVMPDGTVYPCHNFVDPNYAVGNIQDEAFDILPGSAIYRQFLGRTCDALGPCRDCWLQSVCISSFDCASHSEADLGDIMAVDALPCSAGKEIQQALISRYFLEG
jgi:uncharacterized protein